ncbi:MAG: AAA family ATPase [Candidatus Eremiobacteraeota bacterium]|nr:AAA family ATPase [Candidatus Eremiobacteraeota bacterium]
MSDDTHNVDRLTRYLREKPPVSYRTGLTLLDAITDGGARAGHVTVVGGLTGGGKSSLARQMALDMAIDDRVLYVTLEEPEDEVRLSCAAKLARVSPRQLQRTGTNEMTNSLLAARKLRIIEPGRTSIDRFERIMRWTDCPIVILDHVREMDGWIADERGRGVGHVGPTLICTRLSQIAKDTGKALIVLQQLRSPKFAGSKPSMYDLMDTSALAQKAYLVVLVHRPHASTNHDDVAELIVRKNRYGPEGILHYRWQGETGMLCGMVAAERESLTCCKARKPSVPR